MRPDVRIAITGTPGTGKASTCTDLAGRGYVALDLKAEAARLGHLGPVDADGVQEVDVEALAHDLETPAKVTFMYSHFAHLLPSNIAIVLRCRPKILRQRLEARGWKAEKVQENVEAEAIDVITQEAVEGGAPVFEVDTTSTTPSQTADTVLDLLQGKTKGHEAGSVDWTDEVLSWY